MEHAMNYLRAFLLGTGLALCAASASANDLTQGFSGTLLQSTPSVENQLHLGAPFDGSQTGQPFTGSLTLTNLQVRRKENQPFGRRYDATGLATLMLQFPSRSFSVTGSPSCCFNSSSRTITTGLTITSPWRPTSS